MKSAEVASKEGGPRGRGHCPVCSVLVEFQARLIEHDQSTAFSHLCHHHAWELARSESAERAARVFLRLMERSRDLHESGERSCDFCKRLQEQERKTLDEIVRQLQRTDARESVTHELRFCLVHANRLATMVPDDLVELIVSVIVRSRAELVEELRALVVRRAQGDRTGWGVLGRAAEFLTSQRGIAR